MTNRLFFDPGEGERRVARTRPTFTIGMRVVWDKCPHKELEGVVGTVKGIPCDDTRTPTAAGTVAVYFEKALPGPFGGIMPGVVLHVPAEELSVLDAPRNNAN